MKTITLEENFMSSLVNLTDDMKIRIINGLTASMMRKKEEPSIENMFGIWKNNGISADEMIHLIDDNSQTEKRVIVSFD